MSSVAIVSVDCFTSTVRRRDGVFAPNEETSDTAKELPTDYRTSSRPYQAHQFGLRRTVAMSSLL